MDDVDNMLIGIEGCSLHCNTNPLAACVQSPNSLGAVDCLTVTAMDDGTQPWQTSIDIATRSESLGRNGASSTGLGEYIGMALPSLSGWI